MAQIGEIANVSAYSSVKPNAITGAAAVRQSALGPMNLQAYMQGQRAVRDDQFIWAGISGPMVAQTLAHFADFMVYIAKLLHTPNVKTGETIRSIQRSQVTSSSRSQIGVNVFVTTPYAKFLEFGFVHHLSGEWIFNPFMIPAADKIVPHLVDAINQIAEIASGRRYLSGANASNAGGQAILGSARAGLYSYSKFAGDIQALGVTGLSKSRGFALKGAKGIGNYQAYQSGTSASRALRVLSGQLGGKFGRAGVVSGFGTSSLSGPAARIYNRVGGRAFGGALSGIKLPGL